MTTFDGWETQLYGDVIALPGQPSDELAHHGTRGMKWGRRRFQTESGEWTPAGLKERKAREGWGQSRAERKAEKKVARAERKAAKSERKAAKASARAERMAVYKEERRKKDITKLTDEELKKRLERVKMEQEYKELTRSPLLKTGEKLVTAYLDGKAKRDEREAAKAKLALENNRIKADIIRAKENTKRAEADAAKATEDRKKMEADVAGGLKYSRKAELKKAKTEWKGTTLHGNVIRALGAKMNSGLKEKYAAKRKAEGEAIAAKIKTDSDHNVKLTKAKYDKQDNKPYKDRMNAFEKQQQKSQQKTRKEYEKERKRLAKKYGWNQL